MEMAHVFGHMRIGNVRYYNVPIQMGNYQAPEGVAKHCCPGLLDYNNLFEFSWSAGDAQLFWKSYNCSFELEHFVILYAKY
jgi:hypothetical protein